MIFNFIQSLLFCGQPIWLFHFCSHSQDKWRNLTVSTSVQGSRDKSRAPKIKAIVASLPNTPNSAPAASRSHNETNNYVMGDQTTTVLDWKSAPRFVYLFCIQKTYHICVDDLSSRKYDVRSWNKAEEFQFLKAVWKSKEFCFNLVLHGQLEI